MSDDNWKLVANILRDPAQLANRVQTINTEEWSPDTDYGTYDINTKEWLPRTLPWGESWPEHELHADFASFWAAKMKHLGLLELADVAGIQAGLDKELDKRIISQLPRSLALCLPLFTQLKELNVKGEDDDHLSAAARIVEQQSVKLRNTQDPQIPLSLASIKRVTLDIYNEPNYSTSFYDFVRFLCLPSLESLKASEIIQPGFIKPGDTYAEDDDELKSILGNSNHSPLKELILEDCCISWEGIDFMLSMTARTLTSLRLSVTSISLEDEVGSEHRPRELISILSRRCQQSLESLDYRIDTDWLGVLLECSWDDNLTYWASEGGGHTFANTGLNAQVNLTGFPRLKHVRLDAELLINGYGLLASMPANALGHSIVVDGRTVGKAFGGSGGVETRVPGSTTVPSTDSWRETDPNAGLPLDALLPPSLETLVVYCHRKQIAPMLRKLRQQLDGVPLGQAPADLPRLKEVLHVSKLKVHPMPTPASDMTEMWTVSRGFSDFARRNAEDDGADEDDEDEDEEEEEEDKEKDEEEEEG